MSIFHNFGLCALSAVSGAALFWACQKYYFVKPKKLNLTEVIFFPDKVSGRQEGGDYSREEKIGMYKEILMGSPCLRRLMYHLSSAQCTLDLCLYLLTSHMLADAVLNRLEKGGVRVRLIVDESCAGLGGSQVAKFRAKGAFVRMKRSDYLMHHKFAVVDGQTLITGSFNWTMQAVMGNHENVIVTNDSDLVRPFVTHFEMLWNETFTQ